MVYGGIVGSICGIVCRLCSVIVNKELCELLACMIMFNLSRTVWTYNLKRCPGNW